MGHEQKSYFLRYHNIETFDASDFWRDSAEKDHIITHHPQGVKGEMGNPNMPCDQNDPPFLVSILDPNDEGPQL